MAFPTTALLDSFKRANESPLSNGAKWSLIGGELHTGAVSGEGYTSADAFATGEDGAYWTPTTYAAPALMAEVISSGLSAVSRTATLYACLQEPGSATEKSGYLLVIEETKTSPVELTYRLYRMDKAVLHELAKTEKVTMAAGHFFGITVEAGKVGMWHKPGAGEWVKLAEVADATYTSGYVGVGMRGNLAKLGPISAGGTSHSHTLEAAQPQSASLLKTQERKFKVITQNQTVPRITKALAKGLSITQGQGVSMVAFAGLPKIEQPQVVNLTGGITTPVALSLVQAQAVTLTYVVTTKEENEIKEREREEELPHVRVLAVAGYGRVCS